jgi:hypothetical protein
MFAFLYIYKLHGGVKGKIKVHKTTIMLLYVNVINRSRYVSKRKYPLFTSSFATILEKMSFLKSNLELS